MYYFFLISAILNVGLLCMQEDSNRDSLRIVGGEETTIEEHPHQVAIRVTIHQPEFGQHYCGGSLIKLNVVLTAAHCMKFEFPLYKVKAGSKFLGNDGEVLPILSYLNHPHYNKDFPDYDVSIVLLNGSFPEGPKIKIIQIISNSWIIQVGTMATVTGWGQLHESNSTFAKILRQVNLFKLNFGYCKDAYSKLNATLVDRMVCYGIPKGGMDSCMGDSGGPLVAKTYLVGIVSWGHGCARPNFPGLYTNLENHRIRQFIFSNW